MLFEKCEVFTRVLSAIDIPQLAEPFYTSACNKAPGKGSGCDLWSRHGKPLFYYRFGGMP